MLKLFMAYLQIKLVFTDVALQEVNFYVST